MSGLRRALSTYAEARAHTDQGNLRFRRSQPDQARASLERAKSIFRGLGVARDLEQTRRALRTIL